LRAESGRGLLYSKVLLAKLTTVSRRDREGWLLVYRARQARIRVKVLVEFGVIRLDQADSNGVPPLIMACTDTLSHGGIVRLLLDAGANPETKYANGVTALMMACHHAKMYVGAKWVGDLNLFFHNCMEVCIVLKRKCCSIF